MIVWPCRGVVMVWRGKCGSVSHNGVSFRLTDGASWSLQEGRRGSRAAAEAGSLSHGESVQGCWCSEGVAGWQGTTGGFITPAGVFGWDRSRLHQQECCGETVVVFTWRSVVEGRE